MQRTAPPLSPQPLPPPSLKKTGATAPGLYSYKILRQARPHADLDRPIMFLTTMAAMPASTALAIGDDSMSMIGL